MSIALLNGVNALTQEFPGLVATIAGAGEAVASGRPSSWRRKLLKGNHMRYLPDLLAQAKSIDNWMVEILRALFGWLIGA